jgi:hypothetical protein
MPHLKPISISSGREILVGADLEGINDAHAVDLPAMLHVFAEEYATSGQQRRAQQQAVPPTESNAILDLPRPTDDLDSERGRAERRERFDKVACFFARHGPPSIGEHAIAFI